VGKSYLLALYLYILCYMLYNLSVLYS
jgi:hypothetical protein